MSGTNIKFTQLHIGGESQDAGNHPEYVCENCELLVAAECHNDGDRATGAFKVAFSLDGGTPQLEDVESLDPGEHFWLYWRHQALPYGTHHVSVEFDSRDRIDEQDEFDNGHTQEFWVSGAQNAGHTIDFTGEEEVVEGDPDWAAHGWKQIDVGFLLKDYLGDPMTGYNFFVKFYGPQDEESLGTPTVGDSELDAAGLLRCPNVYLKSTGYVHLMAIPTAGGPHEGADLMEQTHRYTLADNATSLSFNVKQRGRDVTVSASNQQQASEKAQLQVGAKVSILKVVELNAGGSKEHTEGEVNTQGIQYQVTVGYPTLDFLD
jgi:CARDB